MTFPASSAEVPRLIDPKEPVFRSDLGQISRLRFLTTVDFPPFSFIDDRQKLAGFNIDLSREICRELNIIEKCEIQALPFGELIDAIEARQGEAIIAGLVPTAENRLKLSFSRPYFQFAARFAKHRGLLEAPEISDFPADNRIGVLAGSEHERMLRAYFPKASAVVFDRRDWMFDDLRQQKIDAVFSDAVGLSFWLASSSSEGCCQFRDGVYFAPDYLGGGLSVAFSNERPELVAATNFALKTLEQKGVISELYLRYFPISPF